jgi:uncharacterized phage-associated protein
MTEETQATTETIQTYPASAVVNYFLDNAKKYNVILTPMKLQKMLYFANGWSLAFYNEPLINDECKAWEYGPVYPSVYHKYKTMRGKEIDYNDKMSELNFDDEEYKLKKQQVYLSHIPEITPTVDNKDIAAIKLCNDIFNIYGKMGAIALSDMTHINVSDNPWLKARLERKTESPTIPKEYIKDYFDRLNREGKGY